MIKSAFMARETRIMIGKTFADAENREIIRITFTNMKNRVTIGRTSSDLNGCKRRHVQSDSMWPRCSELAISQRTLLRRDSRRDV